MAVTAPRWSRKIVALLHDPPDKVFGIAGHEGRAAELRHIALGRDASIEEVHIARQADWIASAADRVDFPQDTEAYWRTENAVLTHPLAGRNLDLGSLTDVGTTDTHEAAKRVVESLVKDVADQRRFLRLWRCLPDELAKQFPRVGALFGMLPADTRQPDHPLTQHVSITAAIADALPQPALLVFSIGPVQEFIAAARRTQDLWMGSWLLSYLSWTAMKSLAEEYGPDVIVFPSLRGQPLCDRWLVRDQEVPTQRPRPQDLALASLPNKFVALLPASEAESAAERAEQAVYNEWLRLTDAVLAALSNGVMPSDHQTRTMWSEQVKTQLEVYWSVLPWEGKGESEGKKQAEAVKSLFEKLCPPSADWSFGKAYAQFAKPKEEGGGQFHPNWGTTYSLLYTLADRAFSSRKSLRDFQPNEERGEKCIVCGQRAALHGQDGSRQGVRTFWSQMATNLKAKNRRTEVKPNGRERLCAVCSVKRFAQREVLEKELGLPGGFPSTSEIAVASFKAAVLQKLGNGQQGEKLADALRDHLDTLQLLDFPVSVARNAIPKLQRLQRQLLNVSQAKVSADELLDYDGEAFFAETFTPKRLKDDYDLVVSESDAAAARESLRTLLKVAAEAGIPRPAKYYAALMMDGDHAGKWLSGTHDGLTCLGNLLHPTVRGQLQDSPEWNALLSERRLMTPAVHAAISDALAWFALKLVRFVVEERYCGRVVYAGGDDVLALLPLDDALAAAGELRALFSGDVDFVDENLRPYEMNMRQRDWKVTFGDTRRSGYLWLDGTPMLTMGPAATASVGIAVAHHMQPLDAALQAMREAEHAAKETYGRNALCIHLLKRSGEEARVGGQWFSRDPDSKLMDTMALVEEVRAFFVEGLRNKKGLSMKFAHAVFDEARTLAHLPENAQQAELKRLLKRHSESTMSDVERNALAERLTAFACALDGHAAEVRKRGFEQMAEWLLLARFLAQGGEE